MEAAQLTATRTRVAMVAPRRLRIQRGVVDMRVEPRDDAELVDQLHFGESGAILGRRSGWAYVQADDHYFGWIPERAAVAEPTTQSGFRIVAVPLADVHERPDVGSGIVDRLPAGSWLPLQPRLDKAGWVWLPEGWVSLDATVLSGELPRRPPTADDLIATAEAFLGVPYLWGGTSGRGIDCSGYVQQVYRLNGVGLDRDADQQALEGRATDAPRAGDLLFFGPERKVTHVGLALDERNYLNAPQKGGAVERATLDSDGRTLLAVRRYLMAEA